MSGFLITSPEKKEIYKYYDIKSATAIHYKGNMGGSGWNYVEKIWSAVVDSPGGLVALVFGD